MGVIYYNTGTTCVVRMLVSIFTLRKFYNGEIAIISDGDISTTLCNNLSKDLNVYVLPIKVERYKSNHHFMVKTMLYKYTPFEQNIYMDADTLIVGNIDELLKVNGFFVTPISNWRPTHPQIRKRIMDWRSKWPRLIGKAMLYPRAINTGVFGFNINDKIIHDWHKYASRGSDLFIPDEISMQLMLPIYEHKLLDSKFNCSCAHDVVNSDTRIIHYHGKKHCDPKYGTLWLDVYREVLDNNICGVKDWSPAGDNKIPKFTTTVLQI
jgi:hypothetical protein